MNCQHCGGEIREEERRWGTVILCPCGKSNAAGTISAWAKANMTQPIISRAQDLKIREEIVDERGMCP